MSEFSFPKRDRLLDAGAYRQVFEQVDAKASHKHLLLLARKNHLQHNRLGLIIAKKHVRLAVQRNRLKRVIRDFFRHQSSSDCSVDVIVLARNGLDQLDNEALSSILRQQWQKLAKL